MELNEWQVATLRKLLDDALYYRLDDNAVNDPEVDPDDRALAIEYLDFGKELGLLNGEGI